MYNPIALLMACLLICTCATAQVSTLTIDVKSSEKIYVNDKDSFQYATGYQLIIRQGTTLFKADSVYISNKLNDQYMEAFGNVYINDNDSVITKAKYLKYLINTKVALLKQDVSITSSGGNITSQEVTYDMNTKLATYTNGATIVSKKSKLTSKAGQYYSNSKDALFTNKVVLTGPEYKVYTDSLYYNVNTEIANFVMYTKVVNIKKNQVIETTRGYYDMKLGIAKFSERSKIIDNGKLIIADKMDMDDNNKKFKLEGKAIYIDSIKQEYYYGNLIDFDSKQELYHMEGNAIIRNEKENFVITGNYLDGDGKAGKFLARGKPVAIIKQEQDSIYIAADTLYSGRIIQKLKVRTDSITKLTSIDTITYNKNDTATRYFEAFHHVRIYSDSVQAVADSLYYSEADSTFRLYQNPIVWNATNQITGDTMYLFTKNKKAERFQVFEKAFVINLVEPKFYNQIKANTINGYMHNGSIDSLLAKGSAEIIFYIQDDAKGFVGVDKSSADRIYSYFKDKEIYKIKWINKYNALTTPMRQANHELLRLRGFTPQYNLRPKSKFELFF